MQNMAYAIASFEWDSVLLTSNIVKYDGHKVRNNNNSGETSTVKSDDYTYDLWLTSISNSWFVMVVKRALLAMNISTWPPPAV